MITDAASTCSGTQVFIGRDDSATSLQWWLGCSQTGGRARFYLVDREGNEAVVTGMTDLTDGAWHHIAATWDASSDTVNLYVDGALESTVAAVYTAGFYSRTAPVNIGWLNLTESYHFVGALDEVAVYNRALSDKEVLQHFTAGTSDLGYCDPLEPIGVGHEGRRFGCNFAVLFPVWDMLFGTADYRPAIEPTGIRDQLPPPQGSGHDYGDGFWRQQWLGLRRMVDPAA